MKVDVNWDIIPIHEINVATLVDPHDIANILKDRVIAKYCYQIMYKGIVLKYGMSADNSWLNGQFGERIYRQLGHMKFWGKKRLTGSSGADWRITEEDFETLYKISIEKDFVKIKIWDLTNYPYVTIRPWDEVLSIESQLIDAYVRIVGEKPIGNINDEAHINRRPAILKQTWDTIFESEPSPWERIIEKEET